jgi:hypothetical protein
MTTTAVPAPAAPEVRPIPTVLALARADARRFARHPLFVLGAGLLAILAVAAFIWPQSNGASPMSGTLLIAFFIGLFGFVVAHRLTTSLRRSGDLADTAPVGARQRTVALCLACLVPASAGTLLIVLMLVQGALWPPHSVPAGKPVAWFADEPDLAVLATLVALGPVAALGGPLLGVAVARWAPFRGSALLGVVVIFGLTALPSDSGNPWRALPPWAVLYDEFVDANGKLSHSRLVPGLSPQWYLGYALCLCGLAVVAALLRDPGDRRPLIWSGIVLAAGAAGCAVLTVS